jgi:hypothetical protein
MKQRDKCKLLEMGWPSFKKSLEPKITANYGGSKVVRILIPKVYINENLTL